MPNIKKNIFNKKKLNHLVSKFDFKDFENFPEKIAALNRWVAFVQSDAFRATKETALQGNFLNEIFGSVLGYDSRLQNPEVWNIAQEQVTNIDGKFADGALGFFTAQNSSVRAVIELKDPNSELDSKQTRFNDNRTPVEQAFSYQHKTGKECRWVIVSNFNEIRLYHSNSSTEYELFFVSELAQPEKFNQFFYLLNSKNLISKSGESIIDTLYKSNEQDEQDISKEFYSVFKKIRIDLFEHLKANNPNFDELILLEKTQKLLDRFIFVCFCEDNYLLPEQIFKQIVKNVESSFNFSEKKIWNEVHGLFNAINLGSPAHNINKFNGGLFAKDEILDSLVIQDGILKEMSKISEYDFDSDIDVNILGHIFEQSINDLEELKSQIEGKEFDKKTSKRKKDGIFYTPEYITKYIVENAVGGWLEDRKKELGFDELPALSDDDYNFISHKKSKQQSNQNIQKHLQFWNAYRETLKNIKVLDPACGSGAFLNQAFNFLYAEGQKVNDTLALLKGGQHELFELDKHILTNNLFGVDINQESVEITKLSLWLKTANKYSELTALDNNIKCGNSLIDDPAVAGEKAFKWEKEFSVVFNDNVDFNSNLQAFHITWATFNSRVSERMIEYEYIIRQRRLNRGEPAIKPPRILNSDEEIFIVKCIKDIVKNYKFRIIGFNICEDHIHLAIVCNPDDIPKIVRTIKSITSRELNIYNGDTIRNNENNEAFGLAQMNVNDNNENNKDKNIGASSNASCCKKDNNEAFGLAQMNVNDNNENNKDKNIGASSNASCCKKDNNEAFGLAQMQRGFTQNHLWQAKYAYSLITNDKELYNVLNYIQFNRNKHQLNDNPILKEIIDSFIIPVSDAFKQNKQKTGFDVVIGNPPYVRADTDDTAFVIQRDWLTKNYKTLYEKWDLMTAFFERSLNLLKENGIFSFIASNSITTSKFSFKLQDWIIENFNIRCIDYFDYFEVFQNVGVVPITIIIDKKKLNINNTINKIYRISDFNNYKIKQIELKKILNFEKNELRSIIFKKEYSKINLNIDTVNLNNICYISVGMVINADEVKAKGEFSKDDLISEIKDIIHSRKYIEGKYIKRYKIDEFKFLEWNTERVPNKLRRPTFSELYEGEKLMRGAVTEGIYDNSGIICNHSIIVFKRYIDLKGINNISINNSITKNNSLNRIGLEEISKQFNLKYILAILNSKFSIKYLNNIRRHRLDNYFYPDDFRKLPIPNIPLFPSPETPNALSQQPFITLADIMLEKNKELQEIKNKFLKLLTQDFSINKLSTKLQNWYELSWAEFTGELKKNKIELTGILKEDWSERFNRMKEQAVEIKRIIDETDSKIDLMVYKLYDLTYEEVKIVEPGFSLSEEEYNNC